MDDSRTLRIDELKRNAENAVSRIEELKYLRALVFGSRVAEKSQERLWLIQVIDNRRSALMDKIVECEKGIELAREAARPEVNALFIDGERVEFD